MVLVIISGVLYFIQTWISTLSMTPEQKKSGMAMLIMSPAMIVVFSFMSPAGVALYWAVGGFVIVIQQIIITFIMKPRMRRRIDEEFTKILQKSIMKVSKMLHLLLFKKISKKSQVNAMKRNVNLADEMLVNKIVSNFY